MMAGETVMSCIDDIAPTRFPYALLMSTLSCFHPLQRKNTAMPIIQQAAVQMRFRRTEREGNWLITRFEKPSSSISSLFASKNCMTSSSSVIFLFSIIPVLF